MSYSCSFNCLVLLTRNFVRGGLMNLPSSPAGLQILYTLLQNVSAEEAAAQSFYQTYFCDVLQHIFSVVTDTSHTAGKCTDLVAREQRFIKSTVTHWNDLETSLYDLKTDEPRRLSAGLTMHATILAYMFNLVEEGKVSVALSAASPSNNQAHVQEYIANLLKTAFPHLQE